MDFLLDALTDWLKEMLVGGIMSNLSGMFDSVNQQVADISVQAVSYTHLGSLLLPPPLTRVAKSCSVNTTSK